MAKRRLVRGAVLALFAAVLAGAGYAALLVRRLDTPAFREALLARAKAAVGAEVRVKEMDVSLLSGVTLRGVAIDNPPPFPGDLLTADAFVLRYRLLPLLAGRVEVERLALERPALALALDARGVFNYERLAGAPKKTAATPAPAAALPLRVVLKRLSVENASIVVTDHARSRLLSVEGADLRSAFEITGGVARGTGEAAAATVDMGGLLFLKALRTPLEVSRESLRLAPLRGRVAGGDLTGEVTVRLTKGFRYEASLEVKGARAETLLAEAKSAAAVSGTLRAKARFEGRGGMATMNGRGEAEVADCRVENARTLALLAQVLKVPELASPDLDQCRLEFVLSGTRLATPVVSLVGRAVRLTGRGTVSLESGALDYEMRLALASSLLARVTARELRTAFRDQGDGFAAIDFRLSGTTREPKTDLLSRVATAAAAEALKERLGGLFRRR